jgi:uncharacterized protein (TIGR02145 family)
VNTGKLCPTGWHVPSDAEWHQLVLFLDPISILTENESPTAGDKLKESGTSHWKDGNFGTNSSGFTALGGGYRHSGFNHFGTGGQWWSSTPGFNATAAFARCLHYYFSNVERHNFVNDCGMSVRCLKD